MKLLNMLDLGLLRRLIDKHAKHSRASNLTGFLKPYRSRELQTRANIGHGNYLIMVSSRFGPTDNIFIGTPTFNSMYFI